MVEGLFIKVGMNKSQPAQGLPSQRIIVKVWDKNTPCTADNNMGNRANPVDQDAYLAAYFGRESSEVSREFRAYYVAMYFPTVNPLNRVEIACLQP